MTEKRHLDTLFENAIRIDSPEARAEFVRDSCGDNHKLRQELEELLQSDGVEDSFLEKPAPGLDPTIVPGTTPDDRAASFGAGLALSFDGESAVVVGDANHSVLKMLGNTINEVPRVSLRESEAEGIDPIARPNSPEVPSTEPDSRYRLDGEIARGGMGAIIKGRDTDLGRDLAIKVLLDSHKDKPEVVQRFVEEAQIGGQLQHPGIAPVYELGQFSDKRPFFAMKLVKGETLSKLLKEREHPTEERGKFLGIFEQVCQTMAYAHSRGVIHRDLKPANIMVGAFGEVQVMDWGLAKVLQAGGIEDEKQAHSKHNDLSIIQTLRGVGSDSPGEFATLGSQTQMGSVMGTPAYMPPEQALGEINCLDERADVFGLGAILCEVLTGKPPYVSRDGASLFRMASRGKLVSCFKRLDACEADADLVSLVRHCLEREPADRPRDAGVLADGLARHLDSVQSRLREAEIERAAQSARADAEALQVIAERKRAEAESQRAESEGRRLAQLEQSDRRLRRMLVGLAAVALIAGVACVSALLARNEAGRMKQMAVSEAKNARVKEAKAAQSEKRATAANAASQVETYRARLSETRSLRAGRETGWRDKALDDLARLAVMPTPRRDLAEIRTEAVAALGTPDIRLAARIAHPSRASGPVTLAFSPDGQTLLTARPRAGLDFWNVAGSRHLLSLDRLGDGHSGSPSKVVYLPDGKGLVIGTSDMGVVFTDAMGVPKDRPPITQGDDQPKALKLSANGQRLAVVWNGEAGTTVHDTDNGEIIWRVEGSNRVVSISPDGRWFARNEGPEIVMRPIESDGKPIVIGRHSQTTAIDFSPTGDLLAASSNDHTTKIWDVKKREHFGTLRGHKEKVLDVAFSPDGDWIATGSLDYTTRIWETHTGQNIATLSAALPGFGSPSTGVKWSPTGEYLAVSLINANQVALYKVSGRNRVQRRLIGHGRELRSVAAHPRSEQIVTSGYSELMTWDISQGRPTPHSIGPNPGSVTSLAYSPNGSHIAVCSGKIVIRESDSGKVVSEFGDTVFAWAMVFDPTGKQLICGKSGGGITVWDIATRRPLQEFATDSTIWSIAHLKHSRRIVSHDQNTIFVFDLETKRMEKQVKLGGVERFVVDPSESRLFVGLADGGIATLSLPDLALEKRVENTHDGGVVCMAVSPDGRLLSTVGATDRSVVLRDAKSLQSLLKFPEFEAGKIRDLCFDSTGRRLAFVGTGSEVHLWDLDALGHDLTAIGLAWDQPAPDVVTSTDVANPADDAPLAMSVLRRPKVDDPREVE